MNWTPQHSHEDASINFTRLEPDGGMLECRFVQRDPHYFIAYLSSHSGCRQACRMCHLTQTRQTQFTPATKHDYFDQARTVIDHWYKEPRVLNAVRASKIHFNWMARGEPLSNHNLIWDFDEILRGLTDLSALHGLLPRFNISTILPVDFHGDLVHMTDKAPVTLFYSLYSMNPGFRARWLPRAQDAEMALNKLASWQQFTNQDIVIHHALIKGENDSVQDAISIGNALRDRRIHARFNLVRYNPYSPHQGSEPDEATIRTYFDVLSTFMTIPGSRIVDRVGFDVKASCGMFMETTP